MCVSLLKANCGIERERGLSVDWFDTGVGSLQIFYRYILKQIRDPKLVFKKYCDQDVGDKIFDFRPKNEASWRDKFCGVSEK